MRLSLLFLPIIIWVMGTAFPVSSAASGLDALEEIASEAPTVEMFMQNQDLQERYFQALIQYQGLDEKTARPGYNAILKQLRTLIKADPAFAQRAWQQLPTEEILITPDAKTTGRILDQPKWNEAIKAQTDKWRREAAPLLALDPYDQGMQAARIIRNAAEDFPPVDASRKVTGEFYASLKRNPEFKAAVAWVLHQKFLTENMRDILGSNSSDLLIDFLKDFSGMDASAGSNFLSDVIVIPQETFTFFKEELSRIGNLHGSKEIFPYERVWNGRKWVTSEGLRNGELTLRKSPRRFHHLFDGLTWNECVGGSCASLESLTPRRWAIPLLESTDSYVVEIGESYKGNLRVVHGVLRTGGKTQSIATLDLGSGVFSKKVIDKSTGESETLFHKTLVALQNRDRTQGQVKRYVLSSSREPFNSGAMATAHADPSFTVGRRFPMNEAGWSFRSNDPLEKTLMSAIKPKSLAINYSKGDQLILNITTERDNLNLRELLIVPNAEYNSALERQLEQLRGSERSHQIAALFQSPDNGRFQKALTDALHSPYTNLQEVLTINQVNRLAGSASKSQRLIDALDIGRLSPAQIQQVETAIGDIFHHLKRGQSESAFAMLDELSHFLSEPRQAQLYTQLIQSIPITERFEHIFRLGKVPRELVHSFLMSLLTTSSPTIDISEIKILKEILNLLDRRAPEHYPEIMERLIRWAQSRKLDFILQSYFSKKGASLYAQSINRYALSLSGSEQQSVVRILANAPEPDHFLEVFLNIAGSGDPDRQKDLIGLLSNSNFKKYRDVWSFLLVKAPPDLLSALEKKLTGERLAEFQMARKLPTDMGMTEGKSIVARLDGPGDETLIVETKIYDGKTYQIFSASREDGTKVVIKVPKLSGGIVEEKVFDLGELQQVKTWRQASGLVIQEKIEGQNGLEWLSSWQKNAARGSRQLNGLGDLLSRAAEQGIYLGDLDPTNLIWNGREWVIVNMLQLEVGGKPIDTLKNMIEQVNVSWLDLLRTAQSRRCMADALRETLKEFKIAIKASQLMPR